GHKCSTVTSGIRSGARVWLKTWPSSNLSEPFDFCLGQVVKDASGVSLSAI
ncbi:hypothetical protein LINPERHAP2_LOCUS23457, partial [Linum perenne]